MKFSTLGLTSIALAGLAMGAAHAQNAQVRSIDGAEARANMEASMKAAKRGQKVGMLTGRLNPKAEKLADGTVMQELDASTMVFSVARIGADGRVETVCVNGIEAADKAMKAPAFAKRVSQVSKEQSNVK